MTHPNLAVGMGLFLEELFAEDVDLYDVSTSHLQFKILCAKATTNSRPMRGRLRKEKTKVFKILQTPTKITGVIYMSILHI